MHARVSTSKNGASRRNTIISKISICPITKLFSTGEGRGSAGVQIATDLTSAFRVFFVRPMNNDRGLKIRQNVNKLKEKPRLKNLKELETSDPRVFKDWSHKFESDMDDF